MKHIVSFSGGKDSSYLLVGMKEKGMIIDEIIMCDTGVEFPEMYDHIKKVEAYMGMPITILKADVTFEYLLLEHLKVSETYIDIGYGFPRMSNRWCTSNLKTAIFKKYLKEKYGKEKIIQYHGIAADERKRMKNYTYPLVDWGITEKQALQNCYDRGFDWGGLYKKFKRVSC